MTCLRLLIPVIFSLCQYSYVMVKRCCQVCDIHSVQRCVLGLNNIRFLYGLAAVFTGTSVHCFTFYTRSVVLRCVFCCESYTTLLRENRG
nr:10kDa-protein [Grapevine leafroll-associated virus 1]